MSVTHFTKTGTNVFAYPQPIGAPVTSLPAQIYVVNQDPISGQFYLTEKELRFKTPSKLFGEIEERADKVINTYESRDTSTGVALTGFKGAGKSVTCKIVCNKMVDKGVPIVIVNAPYSGEGFNSFIESLGEIVVFLDEFGKVYKDREQQQDKLLTLLDGQGQVKRMYIVTENKESLINEFMWDRPGRIYYHFKYSGLSRDTIREFCEDAGLTNIQISQVMELSRTISSLSFDMLSAIVEEMLRYNISAADASEDLNVRIQDYSTLVLTPERIEHKESGTVLKATKDQYDKKPHINISAVDPKTTPEDTKWHAQNRDKYYDDELSAEEEGRWDDIEDGRHNMTIHPSYIVMSSEDTIVYDDGNCVGSFKVSEKVYDYSRFGPAL